MILHQIPLPSYADGTFSDPDYTNQTIVAPGASINVASDTTAGSGKCLRFEVVSDGTKATYRSEISGAKAGGNANPGVMSALLPGTERWVGFSICYNAEADVLGVAEGSIWQLLSSYDPFYLPQQPNAGLSQKNGRFSITTRYDLTVNAPDDSTIIATTPVDLGRVVPGRWTRFVIHLKLSLGNDALIEIYREGVLMTSITTPNTYNRRNPNTDIPLGQYIKFGNYSYSWKDVPVPAGTRTIWDFDYLMVGDHNSSLAEMMDVINNPVPDIVDESGSSSGMWRWQGDDLLRVDGNAVVDVNGKRLLLDKGSYLSDFGVLDNLSDISHWTVVAANPAAANVAEIPLFDGVGPTCFNVTTAAVSGASVSFTKNRTFNLAAKGGMWVLWTNRYLVQGAAQGMNFYLSHSPSLGAGIGRVSALNRLNPQAFGRTCEWLANSDWGVQDGAPNFSNSFESLRGTVSSASQDARDYTMDGILMPLAQTKAQILFTLDDNINTGYTIGHQEAFKRAIPLTHYIIAVFVGAPGHSTVTEIEKMKARGDHIGVHGATQWASNIDLLGDDLKALKTQGLADLEHGAWPNGLIGTGYGPTDVVEAAKVLGMKSIRKTSAGGNGCFLPCYQNPWVLPAKPLNNTMSLSQAKTFVDKAIIAGGTLIFYGHGFGALANATTWTTDDWIQLLDYVAQKRIDGLCECLTINQISFN